jgi:4-carboxymuconolactone decarboxylase
MSNSSPRIPPVPRAEWTDAMRDLFAVFEGPAARENGSRFKAIMTLANHPELARSWLAYNVFLSKNVALPPRLCELVILRVAWRMRSEYEWTQHAVIGGALGINEAELAAIAGDLDAAPWPELELLSMKLVDELWSEAKVEDATWNELSRLLDRKQLLELLFLTGTYGMLAWVFNALRIEPEQMSAEQRREVIFAPDNVYGQRAKK